MHKRLLCIVIIVAFVFSFLIHSLSSLATSQYLSDADEHWAEDYISELFNMGILKGDNGFSLPENNITRGEFIALISRSVLDCENLVPVKHFDDVGQNHIFFKEVFAAKEAGLIIGKSNGYLGVSDSITREEAVIIISRLFDDFISDKTYSFSDISQKYIYKTELYKVCALGIIEGKTNGKFEPYSNTTRAEVSKMVYKILEIYGENDGKSREKATQYFYSPSNAIGTEKEELAFKNEITEFAASLGVSVTKEVSNVKITEEKNTPNLAEYRFDFDVIYTTSYSDKSTKIKEYKGQASVSLLKKNGEWQAYYTNENISLKEKINLTWEIYQNPPKYTMDAVNVISPTYFELISDDSFKNSTTVYSDKSLTLKLTDKSNENYVNYAKENGYDLWIAYRNDFDKNNTEKFLRSEDARKKALKAVIAGVLKCKAEGINLDFENMTNKYDYSNHVRETALAAHCLGLVVSVDITKYDKTSLSWSMCFDRDYLGEITDYTALMAYDQYGSWSKTSGPVASLSWVEESVKRTLGEVDGSKLILGIPFYVRYWREKNGVVVKTGAISMEAAQKMADENNADIYYSEKDGQYVASWSEGGYNYKIYLENAHSISRKVSLVSKYALAGVASWRRGLESMDVWQAIKDNLY